MLQRTQDDPRRRGRPGRLPGAAVPRRSGSAGAATSTSTTTTWPSSSRGCVEVQRVLQADGLALLPRRLPRGPLLQGAAGRDLRPRLLPERDHLGVRLRRPHDEAAGRPSTTTSWSTSRTPRRYFFDADAVERIPYMAPGLVGPEKAARGKLPDRHLVAHHRAARPARSAPATRPRSRSASCGGSSQASSPPGGLVADFFAGSGTTGGGLPRAWPAVPAGRRQSGARPVMAATLRQRAQRRIRRHRASRRRVTSRPSLVRARDSGYW